MAGVGDFQLSQIDTLDDPCPLRQRQRPLVIEDGMQVDEDSGGRKVSFSCSYYLDYTNLSTIEFGAVCMKSSVTLTFFSKRLHYFSELWKVLISWTCVSGIHHRSGRPFNTGASNYREQA